MSDNDLDNTQQSEDELVPISHVKPKRVQSEAQKNNLVKAREAKMKKVKEKKENVKNDKSDKTKKKKKLDEDEDTEDRKSNFDYSAFDKFLNVTEPKPIQQDNMLLDFLRVMATDLKETKDKVVKMHAEKKAKRQMKETQSPIVVVNDNKNIKPDDMRQRLSDIMSGRKYK